MDEKENPEKYVINHRLFLRDGIPFIKSYSEEYSATEGFLFKFKDNESEKAYSTICEI